jgi:hypothetical protein
MGHPHLEHVLASGFTVPFCGRGNDVLHWFLKKFVQPAKRLPVFLE